MERATLSKCERICSYRLIDQLFGNRKNSSMAAFPLRVVFMPVDDGNKILVSVPKRHFKHAVDRNHIKRQVREAYRKNKSILDGKSMAMAFIWMSPQMITTEEVEKKVVGLLHKIGKKA